MTYPRYYPPSDGGPLLPADWDAVVAACSGLTASGYIQYGYKYIIRNNAGTYEAIDDNGVLTTSDADFPVVWQACIDDCVNTAPTGGGIFLCAATYETATPVVYTGYTSAVGAYPLVLTPPSLTFVLTGAGRYSTVIQATADFNDVAGEPNGPITCTNACSIVIEHLFIDMNDENGNGIVGSDGGDQTDRSFMKSYVHDVEIRNHVTGYWGMYLVNVYITNTWDNIYILGEGGGVLCKCTSTGYGNQHWGNIFIQVRTAGEVAFKMVADGAAFSMNSVARIHIDGHDLATTGIELDGSNYNSFFYSEIEHVKYAIKIGATTSTHGNMFLSGFIYITVQDGKAFWCTENARRNVFQNFHCNSLDTITAQLIDDDNDDLDRPNVYANLHGLNTGWYTVGNYITRAVNVSGIPSAKLYGEMLWLHAQNGVMTEFYISPEGMRVFTVYHNLCDTPRYESCSVSLARKGDTDTYECDAGGDTTHTIDAALTQADDYWNGMYIRYLTGDNADESRVITDFDAATDTLVHAAFANTCDDGDTFIIDDDWEVYPLDMRDANTSTLKVRVNVVTASSIALDTAYLCFKGDVNG